MHIRSAIAAAILLIGLASPALAGQNLMLHADRGRVLDGNGRAFLPKCVNLSPWLNPEPYLIAPGGLRAVGTSPTSFKAKLARAAGPLAAAKFWRDWSDHFVTEKDFAHLREQGFNCVRLPLNHRYIFRAGTAEFIGEGIAPVDRAVNWGARHGVFVMLDLHAAPGGQNRASTVADVPEKDQVARLWSGSTAVENRRLTVEMWRALATRYAHAVSVGGYDLLNEPVLPRGAAKEMLAAFYKDVASAIRAVDSRHMLILEGDNYAHDFDMLVPPPDANVMYSFHEYNLFNPAWRDPGVKALQPFLDLRAKTGKPLWLGEFGEEKGEWQGRVVRLLQAHDIGWAVWPWKRIDLRNGHPVIQSITAPDAWNRLTKYLFGAWFAKEPSGAEVRQGMQDMLAAIRTENCTEDSNLALVLAGGIQAPP